MSKLAFALCKGQARELWEGKFILSTRERKKSGRSIHVEKGTSLNQTAQIRFLALCTAALCPSYSQQYLCLPARRCITRGFWRTPEVCLSDQRGKRKGSGITPFHHRTQILQATTCTNALRPTLSQQGLRLGSARR